MTTNLACDAPCHPDCGPIVEYSTERAEHRHWTQEDGSCWHDDVVQLNARAAAASEVAVELDELLTRHEQALRRIHTP